MFLGNQIIFAVAVVLTVAVFYVIDRLGLKVQQATGVVKEKIYREAKTIAVYAGKGRVGVNPLPEAWVLKIEADGKILEVEVAKEFFNKTQIGDRINIEYIRRRITRTIKAAEVPSGFRN